ncbi:hypothetical protein C0Q70_02738 [Pomacea canaliculata]|uniref:Protein FAM151A n=1 Tax=Pomacea canaliculata TaxID=400727 RepID=A0A2T7PQT1_POMCA|nr:hypothetical protein C0Q70_02738 [Pomacea canaliculata]
MHSMNASKEASKLQLDAIRNCLIPKFLIPHMPFLNVGPDVNALLFFDVNNDASKISWARATNDREKLENAVHSDVHMIEGDVILQGQGTESQKMIPVMAEPPQTESDLLLVDWLDKIKYKTNKGIKLDFSSIDAVEISLQRLKEAHFQYPIKFPVWIHADVLEGPHGGKVRVDPSRFFQTLKRVFPKCTVSLGWTTGTHTDLSQSAYTWDMVMDMYELVKKWRIDDQPIVFQVRLSLMHNSVPQLKWLCDNIAHSALNVWHVKKDSVLNDDLMHIAYRFPPHAVFFDLNHAQYEALLYKYRHFSKEKISHYVQKRDEVIFRPQAWLKMGFYIQKDSILPSTEGIILTCPIVYIVTKSTYRPTTEVYIQGRVQFLNRKNREIESFHTGLNIYLRPTAYANFDQIVGIRCFLGVGGEIEIVGSNLPDSIPNFRKTARITPSSANCYRFQITDAGDKVIFQVSSLHDCITLESVIQTEDMHLTLSADIPEKLSREPHPFILRMEDNNREGVIDELSVKHKM